LSSALSERSRTEEALGSPAARRTEQRGDADADDPRPRLGDDDAPAARRAVAGRAAIDAATERQYPRTVHLAEARARSPVAADGAKTPRRRTRRVDVDGKTLRRRAQIAEDDQYPPLPAAPAECVPMAPWQTRAYPNCNAFHDLDLPAKLRRREFQYAGSGGFNHVFRVRGRRASPEPDVALKLLSLSRQTRSGIPSSDMYSRQNYDIVRRDALVSERLTKSPHVLPVYGYCGFATVVPYAADGGTLGSALEQKNSEGRTGWHNMTSFARLRQVADAAAGLADVHDIAVVHGDVAAKQYIVWNGSLRLGDFNQGILLRRNTTAPDAACTFARPVNDGTTRSPEEYRHVRQTSAVDVWSLGSLLHHVLTGRKVWSQSGKKKKAVQAAVVAGLLPKIGKDVRQSADPVDKLLMQALDMCQVYDPSKRASAREVASFLQRGVEELS
jgi:serine/threonine protein kinase